MRKIAANIAGINLSIHIQSIIRPFYQQAILRMIEEVLGPYILKQKNKFPKKSSVSLHFQENPKWELVQDKRDGKKRYYSFYYEEQDNKYIIHYSIGILQLQFLLKRIVEKALYQRGGMIFHCSSCIYNKKTFLFTAKSGGGKSTIMKMFVKAGAIPLSDDNIIIVNKDGKLALYQTPFVEANFRFKKTNVSHDIDCVMFLKKSQENTVVDGMAYSKILSMLGKQILIREWWGSEQTRMLMKFAKSHNFYLLKFSKNYSRFLKLINQKPFS